MSSELLIETDDKQQEVQPENQEPPKKKRKYARVYGSRYEVFDAETAYQTRGGLKKEDLMLSRTGRIVSKKKSMAAKELYKQYGFNKRVKPEPVPAPATKKKRTRKKKKAVSKK